MLDEIIITDLDLKKLKTCQNLYIAENHLQKYTNIIMYTKIIQFNFSVIGFSQEWHKWQLLASASKGGEAIGITRGNIPFIPLDGWLQGTFRFFFFISLICLCIPSSSLQWFPSTRLDVEQKTIKHGAWWR